VGTSPYVKFGNTPIVLLCVVLLGALVFIRRRVGRAEESR
jgi:apolipoprotein N-acyltransferase